MFNSGLVALVYLQQWEGLYGGALFFPRGDGKDIIIKWWNFKGGGGEGERERKQKEGSLAVKRQETTVSAKTSTPQSLRPMGSLRSLLFRGL